MVSITKSGAKNHSSWQEIFDRLLSGMSFDVTSYL
jgi:hypothetical protein